MDQLLEDGVIDEDDTSTSAEARARSLGADHVVVSDAHLTPSGLEGFDVAVDAVGGDVPEWMYAAAGQGGG